MVLFCLAGSKTGASLPLRSVVKDKPLTFKSTVKSSGYSTAPRFATVMGPCYYKCTGILPTNSNIEKILTSDGASERYVEYASVPRICIER